MKQILHILRKDARHHWPEILAALILLTACFVEEPREWAHRAPTTPFFSFLAGALPVLLFVSWAFLIERLVHGESLVGERQFWITRPYEWRKLLAAKLLGIVMFIHVPLFVAQIALLAYGHFPIGSAILPLLAFHLTFALLLVIPMMAIAAVTAGTGSTTLGLLIILVAVIGMTAGFSMMPDADLSISAFEYAQEGIYTVTCVAVVLCQYARRRAWLARLAIVGCMAVIATINLGIPHGMLIAHTFPVASASNPSPAEFGFDDSLVFTHRDGKPLGFSQKQVQLELPLKLTGLGRDTVVNIWGAKLEFETSGGEHLASRWQNIAITLIPGRTRAWPGIALERSLFDKLQGRSVKTRLTLALNVYRETSSSDIQVQDQGFAIRGGARCTSNQYASTLQCFASIQQPQPGIITADLPAPHCESKETRANEPFAAAPAAYVNVPGDSSPEFPLMPVRQFVITTQRFGQLEDQPVSTPMCVGTPLTFHTVEFTHSNRIEIELGKIDVLDYVPGFPREIRKRSITSDKPLPDMETRTFHLFFGTGD
jgi:hypothetical protein